MGIKNYFNLEHMQATTRANMNMQQNLLELCHINSVNLKKKKTIKEKQISMS